MTKDLIDDFKKEWEPLMDNVEKASKAFDDIEGLMDGPEGFALSSSLWKKTGWTEVDDLRKKLENLRELRDLVRKLGASYPPSLHCTVCLLFDRPAPSLT